MDKLKPPSTPSTPRKREIREQFPIFRHHPELIYLDSAATTHKPQQVIDALIHFYAAENATVHRAIYRPSLIATEKYNATRAAAQHFLNAKHFEEIVFTRGTTDALNLVAQSYGRTYLKAGDEILISQMEHHSNIVPWQMLAEQTGAILRWISMNRQGILEWEGHITPRTKLVALAHMSNVTGTINPIREIAIAAHQVGAILVVDGAQAAAHLSIDVQAEGCDFYAFSGHKCYGPTGIGILYGKRELLEKMPPIQGGGDMIETVDLEKTTYREPPMRFEAGTPIIGPAIALKAALDFLQTAPKPDLLPYATQKLLEIPRLRILGTAPDKGPLITFHIDGVHPLDLGTLLDLRNIALRTGHLCAQPVLKAFGLKAAARISFGAYNTLEEIDLFCEALREAVSQVSANK